MKDLEKIKSEDLACQVADANPANFAIEQEVAAMVGATVPQPTEPSADDARELPAQLLVFLRRALLPIRSALRTALAAIYAHLDSRCSDYTPAAYAPYIPRPYDPMGSTPRTLPNLLTALTAFSARKISNGSALSDGIPDGTSLAHILGDSSVVVTKLEDDNKGWTWNRALPSIFGSLTKLQMGCSYAVSMYSTLPTTLTEIRLPELLSYGGYNMSRPNFIYNNPNITELTFDKLQMASTGFTYDTADEGCFISTCANLKKIYFPELVAWGKNLPGHGDRTNDAYCCLIHSCAELEEVYMPKWTGVCNWRIIRNCPKVWRVVLGNITSGVPSLYSSTAYPFDSCVKLRDLEFAGVQVSLDLSSWAPDAETIAHQDFLQNFREHIALRLTSNGSGKTLTLSQAVRDAIHAAEATYGIEAIIVTQKGWTLSPAPGASSQ